MCEEKSAAELLRDELFSTQKNAALTMTDEEIHEADRFCEGYRRFLNTGKTEREAVDFAIKAAAEKGFRPFDSQAACKPGDKLYYNNRGKAVILAVIGQKGLAGGVKLIASHIDAPRVDLKPNPLYEDSELALLKTHYYGGIKKYQWTAVPLSLHGVVILKNGQCVAVNIGEQPGEPRFVITDLLPHLAGEQLKRTLSEAIKGEELNVLVGSRPFRSDKGSELVKLNILKLLNEKYAMTERDFLCAELELVPAYEACDIGLDRSMIGGYGHDDRVCAYPSLAALLETDNPEYTAVAVLADKEETGSEGNTGLESRYLENFIAALAHAEGLPARDVLCRSECLSADVNAAFDPTFPSVLDKLNAAYLNKGIVVTKYSGSRGKSGTSDASAEFLGRVRDILDGAGVVWQTGELGKVDEGGGGTVAKYVAGLDVEVVDVGVPVLSMHSPFEVVSKLDVYMAYKAFKAFFNVK